MTSPPRCARSRVIARLVGGLVIILGLSAAQAQDYPARPVTMVVPFAAGGGTDIIARMIAARLEARLGKPALVENKPGGGTFTGATAVAKSAPDGHTLLVAASTTLAVNPNVFKVVPFDPVNDFVPIAALVQFPFVLIVNPDLPVKSVPELIAYAKANPGKLSFGSSGPGTPHHLFMEMFKGLTGVEMTHVPYRGSLPALNDVVAGHIPLMFCDIAPALEMIRAGKVRALGLASRTPMASLPDVPAIADAGVPGFDAIGWMMLVAPAKTPRAVVDRLHAEVKNILVQPDIQQQFTKLAMLRMPDKSVEDLREFVKSELVRWGKVVRDAGLAASE